MWKATYYTEFTTDCCTKNSIWEDSFEELLKSLSKESEKAKECEEEIIEVHITKD